jgi:type I restriction enzyme S subunit
MLASIDLSSYGYARHFKFLKQQKLVLPGERISQSFETFTATLFYQIKNNQKQNQELTELRDWLLPMLMNGQVSVE